MGFLTLRRNVDLDRAIKVSRWRKLAIGAWKTHTSPAIYAVLDVNVTKALKHIEKIRSENPGSRITLTHLVTQIMARSIEKHPEINRLLRWGKLYQRKSVDICVMVAPDAQGHDLTVVNIQNANQKNLLEIAAQTENRVKPIKRDGDKSFKLSKKLLTLFPSFLSGFAVGSLGNFLYSLNLWTPALGLPKDPFGGVILTNIGSLGLDFAFAPLVPLTRVPLMIALGAVREKPVAENGQVIVAPMIRMCFTADHRLVDGIHGGLIAATIKNYFNHPESI